MRPVTIGHIIQIATKCPPVWADALCQSMPLHNIDTPERAAMFLAQCAHESTGFTVFEERLVYSSPERILETFKRLRPLGIEGVADLVRNPKALANRAYAGINGNGDEYSGDGFKYRGRGCIQLTGRDNYQTAGLHVQRDLVKNPDDAAAPYVSALVAGWFWQSRGCNPLADAGDFEGVTKRINGGLNGLADRKHYLHRARRVLAP